MSDSNDSTLTKKAIEVVNGKFYISGDELKVKFDPIDDISTYKDPNLEVIENFLSKMRNQDNRCTAAPYFYVIRTEVKDWAPLDNCDEVKYYWQDHTYDSIADVKKSCKENGFSKEETQNALREVQEFGIKYRWEHRGMFLTETDAKEHLRLNHYHYSHNAHTYVDHAWRAPELSAFFEALFAHFQIPKGNV